MTPVTVTSLLRLALINSQFAVRSSTSALSLIHHISLSIQAHFLMHAADSADHYGVPGFREVFFLLHRGRLDDQLLVGVLPAIVARLRARYALRALACDYRQA